MISMAKFINGQERTMEDAKDFFLRTFDSVISSIQLGNTKKKDSFDDDVSLNKKLDALYARRNAERTNFPTQSFDLATIMYAFHEAPYAGRYRMLREARRLLRNGGTLAVVDISPEYEPSPTMLAGEPYVLEYKKNIVQQMKSIQGFSDIQYHTIVPGHVVLWLLTRDRSRFLRDDVNVP
mmetsp:Transcript_32187/g.47175  ORF Transcript_32187/g.47175 Transcript_32187/m.47175 type:complete len:180 (+) Transcript_32187:243-782(+)